MPGLLILLLLLPSRDPSFISERLRETGTDSQGCSPFTRRESGNEQSRRRRKKVFGKRRRNVSQTERKSRKAKTSFPSVDRNDSAVGEDERKCTVLPANFFPPIRLCWLHRHPPFPFFHIPTHTYHHEPPSHPVKRPTSPLMMHHEA